MDISIEITQVSKRYIKEWIFKDINITLLPNNYYAILGHNGSGKSTLLQIIAGSLSPTKGTITYKKNHQPINNQNIFLYQSIAAPYMELIEEFTLLETINFQAKFKPFLPNIIPNTLPELLLLENAKHKLIKHFSSGMKQRLKIGLAIFANTPLLFLDEPTSNLDADGINWYKHLIQNYTQNRLVCIASNQPYEYEFCQNLIQINQFKPINSI